MMRQVRTPNFSSSPPLKVRGPEVESHMITQLSWLKANGGPYTRSYALHVSETETANALQRVVRAPSAQVARRVPGRRRCGQRTPRPQKSGDNKQTGPKAN